MRRFVDRTVLVTGAARGLGRAHARAFVAEGARVLLTDVHEEEGQRLAEDLGRGALFVRHDVSSEQDWDAAVATAEDAFGPVSVLVNNASLAPEGQDVLGEEPEDWRRVLDVSLFGAYLGIRAVTPSMCAVEGGSIVNVSSVAACTGSPGGSEYGASTWALRGLTTSAAPELSRLGVRVNAVFPGAAYPMAPQERRLDAAGAALVLDRVPDEEKVSRVVLFAASEEAASCAGTEFVVDGSLLPGRPYAADRPNGARAPSGFDEPAGTGS